MVPKKAIAIAAVVVVALVVAILLLVFKPWSPKPEPDPNHSTTTTEASTTTTTKKVPLTPPPSVDEDVTELPRGKFKFTRCDGLDEPLGPITISACPDAQNKDYCEILQKSDATFTIELTPARYIAKPRLGLKLNGATERDSNKWTFGRGETSALEAHKKQTVSQTIAMPSDLSSYTGSAKLSLSDGANGYHQQCVEFPIKIVKNL